MDEVTTTVERLRALAPNLHFSMDPQSALVSVEVDGMAIHDPFISECGRFPCTPDYYGVPLRVALVMVEHNIHALKSFEE